MKKKKIRYSLATQLRNEGGKLWYVRMVDIDGKRKYYKDPDSEKPICFLSEEQAKDFVETLRQDQENEIWVKVREVLKNKKTEALKQDIQSFLEHLSTNAPTSYIKAPRFFQNYILPFFVLKLKLYTEGWNSKQTEFERWLETARPVRTTRKDRISSSTQHHIRSILRSFLSYLDR